MKWRLDAGQIEVVEKQVAEILRRKTPAQRVAMISEANEMARLIVEGGIRTRHPEWDDPQVQAELRKRMSSATG